MKNKMTSCNLLPYESLCLKIKKNPNHNELQLGFRILKNGANTLSQPN